MPPGTGWDKGVAVPMTMKTACLFICCIICQLAPPAHAASDDQGRTVVLDLEDIIQLALAANRNVLGAANGVESRQWTLTANRSEFEWKFLPFASTGANDVNQSAGAGLRVAHKFTPGPAIEVGPQIVRYYPDDGPETTDYEMRASLSVPLLRGSGRATNLSGVHAAEYDLRSARRSQRLTQVNTVLDAVSSTYQIVQQREMAALFHSQAARFQNHAVIATAKKKIGLATPIDVYRAEIRMRDAQSGLRSAQEALRNAMDRLRVILATPLDPDQVFTVTAPLEIQPLDLSLQEAVDTALIKRVELRQAREEVAEAERLATVARRNLYPDLDLVANYTRSQYDRYNDFYQEPTDTFTIQLTGSTDWSRTAARAGYQKSQLAVSRARLNRESSYEAVKQEVHQVYLALLNAREQIRIRGEQIAQAEGKLALAKIKFNHGMANNFDIIESETELQQANTDLLSAKINYLVGVYRLRAAIGMLLEG